MPPIEDFSARIARWFDENQRALPWRETTDAYCVWVSEIILQQTRVAQGLDYYKRFITRFPTVEALASASDDEVMRQWEGLGYYSRARNLHYAAQKVVAAGKGFPSDYAGIRALKGVGDYTAAAVASFCFGEPYAVVDGNVYRVLARCFGIDTPIDTTAGKRIFLAIANACLDRKNPAKHNQAIMDFGAMQCVPQSPYCERCVLMDRCEAKSRNEVQCFPVKTHKTKSTTRYFVYYDVENGAGRRLWHKRTGKDIWKGLYEPYLVEFDHSPSIKELNEAVASFAPHHFQLIRRGLRHVLTHQVIWADYCRISTDHSTPTDDYKYVSEQDIETYAKPRLLQLLSCDQDRNK